MGHDPTDSLTCPCPGCQLAKLRAVNAGLLDANLMLAGRNDRQAAMIGHLDGEIRDGVRAMEAARADRDAWKEAADRACRAADILRRERDAARSEAHAAVQRALECEGHARAEGRLLEDLRRPLAELMARVK
jgi:hypothetical protein